MELLRQVLADWEVLQQSLEYELFFQLILNPGYVFPDLDGSCVGEMTPLSPPYAAAMLEAGQQLGHFESMIEAKNLPTEAIRNLVTDIDCEVFFTHLYHYMRWFTISPEGELCHIALRPTRENRLR